ncbi:MAG: nucleotidyl transferase AbiEii/AbiGii toxin family protein, partial [Candidatus Eisenbacteria sp.]|nr:nucleotidyl transferase AbiEii/AbiGii toxin family protein [Candidatus Eisenbacteria bacterium]
MVQKRLKDVAASVHQRLLNESQRAGKPFNALLDHYALERFLYRLSKTEHAKSLVLKGGLLLIALEGPRSRATRDADFSSVVHLEFWGQTTR